MKTTLALIAVAATLGLVACDEKRQEPTIINPTPPVVVMPAPTPAPAPSSDTTIVVPPAASPASAASSSY